MHSVAVPAIDLHSCLLIISNYTQISCIRVESDDPPSRVIKNQNQQSKQSSTTTARRSGPTSATKLFQHPRGGKELNISAGGDIGHRTSLEQFAQVVSINGGQLRVSPGTGVDTLWPKSRRAYPLLNWIKTLESEFFITYGINNFDPLHCRKSHCEGVLLLIVST